MATGSILRGYTVVAGVEIAAVALEARAITWVVKPLLMLLLLAWVTLDARGRTAAWPSSLRWLVAGMVFAWLGDVLLLLDGDTWFLGGIAAFAVMQVCYLVAFLRVPGIGLVRAWRVCVVPYALVWVAVNVATWGGSGALRPAVLVYSALAVAMALGALDVVLRLPRPYGWRVAGGGMLFVASDTLIALTAFGPLDPAPAWDVAIMATYVAAQAAIVTGLTCGVRGR